MRKYSLWVGVVYEPVAALWDAARNPMKGSVARTNTTTRRSGARPRAQANTSGASAKAKSTSPSSKRAENAAKPLKKLKRQIEGNEYLRWVFPGLRPGKPWTDDRLRVEGAGIDTTSDTVEVYGLDGSPQDAVTIVMGHRPEYIADLLDKPIDVDLSKVKIEVPQIELPPIDFGQGQPNQ